MKAQLERQTEKLANPPNGYIDNGIWTAAAPERMVKRGRSLVLVQLTTPIFFGGSGIRRCESPSMDHLGSIRRFFCGLSLLLSVAVDRQQEASESISQL